MFDQLDAEERRVIQEAVSAISLGLLDLRSLGKLNGSARFPNILETPAHICYTMIQDTLIVKRMVDTVQHNRRK